MTYLIDLKENEEAIIDKLIGGSNFIFKLHNLGIYEGTRIKVKKKSKVCPVLINVNESTVAIGRGMCSKIAIKKTKESL